MNSTLELRKRPLINSSSNCFISSVNYREAIQYGGLVGGFTPSSSSMRWSTPLCDDRVFRNSGDITLMNSFRTFVAIIDSWVASISSDSSLTMATKVNSSFCTTFFSCKANIYFGSLVHPQEIRTMQGSLPPIRNKKFRNDISTNFIICMNSISRITWKSSNGTIIIFVFPLHVLILIGTPFTSSEIYLAKFIVFIQLGLFSEFSPSCLASQLVIEL